MMIFLDDGSTSVKGAFLDGSGEVKTFKSVNSFAMGKSVIGAGNGITYKIGAELYHYSAAGGSAETTLTAHQYSTLAAVAVQHALQVSGLEPQPVDIVVSLPLDEYYTRAKEPHSGHIEAKCTALMQPVEVIGGHAFPVKSVQVLPESIPAGYTLLRQLKPGQQCLIVDVGGTSTDVSLVSAGLDVVELVGNGEIGVSTVTRAVRDALDSAYAAVSPSIADGLIQNADNPAYLNDLLNTQEQLAAFRAGYDEGCKALAQLVVGMVKRIKGRPTHVMVVGGGAPLVAPAIAALPGYPTGERFVSADEPQLALVVGMLKMIMGE